MTDCLEQFLGKDELDAVLAEVVDEPWTSPYFDFDYMGLQLYEMCSLNMPPLAPHTEGGHSSAVPLLRSLADSAVVVLAGVLEMMVSLSDSNAQRPWCIFQLSLWNGWSAWIQYGYPILKTQEPQSLHLVHLM